MIPTDARLLRIYVDASDRWQGRPLYEAIVARARAIDVAGASVFSVEMSYGAHRRIHDAASEYDFVDLPVIVEVVDAPGRIDDLLSDLGAMIAGAMTTVQSVRVIRYAHTEPEVQL